MAYEKTNFGKQNKILKSLAISKIVHLTIITKVPNIVIGELKQNEKKILCDNKKIKIKSNTQGNGYKDGALKSVDTERKAVSLNYSWIKRLYIENFHNW